MAWVETVPEDEARGTLAEQYAASRRRDGRLAAIVRAMSQSPAALADLMRLHATVAHGPSGLSRAEREMVALVVSRANRCRY
jgi:alkylhydroperoxidase family enzyme